MRGQRILLTGASSGLGRAACVQLAQAGATVLACARREDRLLDLAEAHPTVEPHVLDVSDLDAVAAFCAALGPVDGAILNAGITEAGPFSDSSAARDAQLIATNVSANVALARGLRGALSGGRLVFVGSLGGMVPLPYQAVYSGSKAFLHHFALALREEWAGDVSVGVFAPGGIRTEMTEVDALAKLDAHLADADAVAGALLDFYGSTRALSVPGGANKLTAAAARVLPRGLVGRVVERLYREG